MKAETWSTILVSCLSNIKGAVSRYSLIFCAFLRKQKMAPARASVADIRPWQLGLPHKQLHRPPAESSKCRFPRAIVVFRGLALWPPLFFLPENGCQKINDYRDTAALTCQDPQNDWTWWQFCYDIMTMTSWLWHHDYDIITQLPFPCLLQSKVVLNKNRKRLFSHLRLLANLSFRKCSSRLALARGSLFKSYAGGKGPVQRELWYQCTQCSSSDYSQLVWQIYDDFWDSRYHHCENICMHS